MSSPDCPNRYYCQRHGWRVLITISEGVTVNTSQFADYLNNHNLDCVCPETPFEMSNQAHLSDSFNGASQGILTAQMEALRLQAPVTNQSQSSTHHHHQNQPLESFFSNSNVRTTMQNHHVQLTQPVQPALKRHQNSPPPENELEGDPDYNEGESTQPFVELTGYDGYRAPQLPLNLNPEMQPAYYTEPGPSSQNQSTTTDMMQPAYFTDLDIFLHPTEPPPSQDQSTTSGFQYFGASWDESLNEKFE